MAPVRDRSRPVQQNWFLITAKDTVTAKGEQTRTIIP
jgi:hypothetical protein